MKNHYFLNWLFIFLIIILINSCEEDDPIKPQEDHFEAIGVVLYESGIEIARILRGETADTLIVEEGERTSHIDVKFFDEDENIIDPPESEEQILDWEFEDPAIAGIWQHEGEEGGFEIHLEGLSAGETNVEFFIVHEAHADYRSGKIPVRIEPSQGGNNE